MPDLTLTSLKVVPRAPSVDEAVKGARIQNATTVAWARAVLFSGTLVAHAAAGALSTGAGTVRLVVHAFFAAAALAIVVLLNGRLRSERVVKAGAAVDGTIQTDDATGVATAVRSRRW